VRATEYTRRRETYFIRAARHAVGSMLATLRGLVWCCVSQTTQVASYALFAPFQGLGFMLHDATQGLTQWANVFRPSGASGRLVRINPRLTPWAGVLRPSGARVDRARRDPGLASPGLARTSTIRATEWRKMTAGIGPRA
jgi:hypothetical protein